MTRLAISRDQWAGTRARTGKNLAQSLSRRPRVRIGLAANNPNHSMFTRFDATKSTKGASKLRRDLINAEIANLRDLLPLPPSTRQRLSQLQLMALVCVYVRKANYFQQEQESRQIFKHEFFLTQHVGRVIFGS
ncbi:hypothetical protein GE061_012425 [Apolygus lucorum]|uniref:BHLH domain-containing protein n=1 Tax=Apolygus lucorum TaxID=248454 RepID=A0A8S9XUJ3_APOLU|nr:hypothetical protein GE061_012425 [Apolygus lucorum]